MRLQGRLFSFFLFAFMFPAGGFGNPFSPPEAQSKTAEISGEEEEAGNTAGKAGEHSSALSRRYRFGRPLYLQKTVELQREIRERLASFIRKTKNKESSFGFLLIFLLSSLYGILHAVGPGHRKGVLISYFLSRQAKLSRGLLAGPILGFMHGLTVIAGVFSVYFLFRVSLMRSVQNMTNVLAIFSYGAVLVLGVVLLVLHIVRYRKTGRGCSCGAAHRSEQEELTEENFYRVILFSSLVPCPGAAMILIFALSFGAPLLGIWAVGGLSAGMALTLSLICVLTIIFKEKLVRFSEKREKWGLLLHEGIEISGYVFLILISLFMLIPALFSAGASGF